MGRFTEDMGRLRDTIEADRHARYAKVADTRQAIGELKGRVDALQADFRAAHADMAQAGRAERNAFLTHIGNAVGDIRSAAAQQQAQVRDALAASAAATRADLAHVTAARRAEVADLRDDFVRAHDQMALEVRAAGHAFVANIVGSVATLKRQADALVDEFAAERHAGAHAWRTGVAKAAPAPVSPAKPAPEPAKPAPKAKFKAAAPAEGSAKAADKASLDEVRPATEEGPGV